MAPKFKNWFVGSIRLCLLWHHVSSAFFRLYSGLPTGIISNWLRSKFLRRKCIAMFHPDYSSSICRAEAGLLLSFCIFGIHFFCFPLHKNDPTQSIELAKLNKKIIWADFKILFSWFRLFLPNAFGWVNLPTGDVSTNYFCVIENFGLLALETLYFLDFRYAQSNLDSDLPFPLGDDLESLQITEWPREKTNYSKKRQASFIFKLEFLISRLFFPLFSFSPARIKFTTLLI